VTTVARRPHTIGGPDVRPPDRTRPRPGGNVPLPSAGSGRRWHQEGGRDTAGRVAARRRRLL